jgi:hypothetical protein
MRSTDEMIITLHLVVDENNVRHQIDIDMVPIIYSEEGENKVIWRSMDGKYRIQAWITDHDEKVKAENVEKDEKVISTVVEIADQINRFKEDFI